MDEPEAHRGVQPHGCGAAVSVAGVSLDWGKLTPLRLCARNVADGVYAGTHRSARRGTGVEFGGHRNYVPGDDLRWLDRHAMMRHQKLVVRQFETETDRTLCLLVDGSASMGFRGPQAPGAKLAFAAVIAAAMARIALSAGDPVSLNWLGGAGGRPVGATGGKETFERIVASLEAAAAGGDLVADTGALDRALAPIARRARRGAIIVFLSDLIDLPPGTVERVTALGTGGRTLVVARVLDPLEVTFPFEGPVRLRASEGNVTIETDAGAVRARYLAALEEQARVWADALTARGGHIVSSSTADDPVEFVRRLLRASEGRPE